jgi:hypothetical protein
MAVNTLERSAFSGRPLQLYRFCARPMASITIGGTTELTVI